MPPPPTPAEEAADLPAAEQDIAWVADGEATRSAATGNKRKRGDDDETNSKTLLDIKSLFAEVTPVLSPPDDPSFSRQGDYLNTLLRSIDDGNGKKKLTWESLAGAISAFLSYYMVRKIYGEDEEGLRSAARAMYNLVRHCQVKGLAMGERNVEQENCNNLLAYTSSLAKYPYEVGSELQSLWDTFYWEKKEAVYPYLKKSKFSLEPGDCYTKTVDGVDGVENTVEVVIKESDMVMTRGDINKLSGTVSIYLAIARVMGVIFRDRGTGCSTREYRVRGQNMRIYTGRNAKEEGAEILEDYRVDDRPYEKKLIDEIGGRIKIERVCKDGWWMAPESSFRNKVFVPLTAKVAKMGVVGTVFSGMRLGLAGSVWRPLPSGEGSIPSICYNVYPPDLYDFEG